MNGRVLSWTPAGMLALAALFTVGIDTQRSLPLRSALDTTVPLELFGYAGHDVQLTTSERRVAGVSNYLVRNYAAPAGSAAAAASPWFQVYVGYFEQQTQGKTIHSPKNCLPGSGWEPLASRTITLQTPNGPVTVNRYLLKREDEQALVLYWYQGRGRVEANEYVVKWDLLKDAALRHHTEEALVRVVVPVSVNEAQAYDLAAKIAAALVPSVGSALPL